jgi:hypothetical protein
MHPTRFFATSLLLMILVAGCGGATPAPSATPLPTVSATTALVEPTHLPEGTPPGFPTVVEQAVVTNPLVIALLANLQRRGFPTEQLDASRDELQTDAPGQAYRLGDGWLHVHIYSDAAAAAAAAVSIENDPRLSILDWVAPPYYFQCDRLIVLYLGADARMVQALSELCAPPFYAINAPSAPVATKSH